MANFVESATLRIIDESSAKLAAINAAVNKLNASLKNLNSSQKAAAQFSKAESQSEKQKLGNLNNIGKKERALHAQRMAEERLAGANRLKVATDYHREETQFGNKRMTQLRQSFALRRTEEKNLNNQSKQAASAQLDQDKASFAANSRAWAEQNKFQDLAKQGATKQIQLEKELASQKIKDLRRVEIINRKIEADRIAKTLGISKSDRLWQSQKDKETRQAEASGKRTFTGRLTERAKYDIARMIIDQPIYLAGQAVVQGAKQTYLAGARRSKVEENLLQGGFSPEQERIIAAAAATTSQKYGVVSQTESMDAARHVIGVAGDFEKGLSQYLKYGAAYSALESRSVGQERGVVNTQAIARFIAESGKAGDDNFVHAAYEGAAKARQAEGVNFDPLKYLNFLRMSGAAKYGMSEKFLTQVAPVVGMMEGSARFGTQMNSLSRQLAGTATKKAKTLIQGTILSDGKGGYNPDVAKQLFEDPLLLKEKFLDRYLEQINARYKSKGQKGFDVNDPVAVNRELSQAFPNRSATQGIMAFLENLKQIELDLARQKKSDGLDSSERMKNRDLDSAFLTLTNSMDGLGAAITDRAKPTLLGGMELATSLFNKANALIAVEKDPVILAEKAKNDETREFMINYPAIMARARIATENFQNDPESVRGKALSNLTYVPDFLRDPESFRARGYAGIGKGYEQTPFGEAGREPIDGTKIKTATTKFLSDDAGRFSTYQSSVPTLRDLHEQIQRPYVEKQKPLEFNDVPSGAWTTKGGQQTSFANANDGLPTNLEEMFSKPAQDFQLGATSIKEAGNKSVSAATDLAGSAGALKGAADALSSAAGAIANIKVNVNAAVKANVGSNQMAQR